MAVALTADPTSTSEPLVPVTLTITDGQVATAYTIRVLGPSGFVTEHSTVTDGDGEASVVYVPQDVGGYYACSYYGSAGVVEAPVPSGKFPMGVVADALASFGVKATVPALPEVEE